MEDLPIDKIQIPGPTLASLLHHLTTSSSDISGFLFGTISSSATTLSDEPTTPTTTPSSATTTTATVTSFLSSPSFYSSSGQILPPLLPKSSPKPLIGWFSGRRKTPLRPSLRETTVTSNLSAQLSLSPTLFLLLTTPPPQQQQQSPPLLIHTHDYRFFHLRVSGQCRMEPKSVEIINIGPAFRGQYDNYCSNSLFPDVACGNSMVAEEDNNGDQEKLDMCAEGFDVGRLNQLTGSVASGYTGELEDLYSKMLVKLNGLARLVEKSSARVLEQETKNMKLRHKVAGLE